MHAEERKIGHRTKRRDFSFFETISHFKKNIDRLKILAESPDSEVSSLAGIVLEVANVKPYKKKRLIFLAKERKDLLEKLDEKGLIYAHQHY
jgi:hypothetical protein